jgi:hypothetical protein
MRTARPTELVPLPSGPWDGLSGTEIKYLSWSGVDTLIETRVHSVVLAKSRFVQLQMTAGVKAIRTADEKNVWSDVFPFNGRQFTKEEWSVEGATTLANEIGLGYRALAEKICDKLASTHAPNSARSQ